MPEPDARMLNVREVGEEGPLASGPSRRLEIDGGGLATRPACG